MMIEELPVTKLVILFTVLILVLFDIWATWWYGPERSISVITYELCCQYPIIAFGLGLIVGHILWPVKCP